MENEEVFRFLFDLQRGGRHNMLTVAPLLMNRFGLNRFEANDVLLDWCDRCEEIAKELNIDF